jgi:hypothetical protein
MLTYAIILAVALAGYLNAPALLVPAAAACLTLDSWKPWRPDRRTRIEWTSKTTTYFVTGIVADLGVTSVAFGAGRIVRFLVG